MKKLCEWVGDMLLVIAMLPFFIAGYIAHKICKYVILGLVVGWSISRDIDS